jgi:iron(III) transport system ATP-binding protein
MLRPEQIRIAEDGNIRGTVVETDFFGPEVTVKIRLHGSAGPAADGINGMDGQTVTIRHWNAAMARVGTELRLRVVGEGVAFPA